MKQREGRNETSPPCSDRKVRLAGDTALVTGQAAIEAETNGQPRSLRLCSSTPGQERPRAGNSSRGSRRRSPPHSTGRPTSATSSRCSRALTRRSNSEPFLLRLLTTAVGTKRTFYACRRMSVLQPVFGSIHRTCLSPLVTDRVMEAWYHPSIARMTPNRRVTWQATSNDENS